MSDPNGWPDAARPGYPLNPERPGAHALKDTGGTVSVMLWRDPWWHPSTGWAIKPAEMVAARWRYLGPCITPAEVAAREAAAYQRGAEAMREAAAQVSAAEALAASFQAEEAPPDSPAMLWHQGRCDGTTRVATAIRDLPISEDKP